MYPIPKLPFWHRQIVCQQKLQNTYIHTCTYRCIHKCYTYVHAYMYLCYREHLCICIYAWYTYRHKHACTYTCIHTCMQIHIHTNSIHMCIHTCIYVIEHIYAYAWYTYIHQHACTCAYIYNTHIYMCVFKCIWYMYMYVCVCVVVIIIIIKYKHILQSQDRFNLQVQNTHYQQLPLKNKSKDPYISTKKGKIVMSFINISIRDPVCNNSELFDTCCYTDQGSCS